MKMKLTEEQKKAQRKYYKKNKLRLLEQKRQHHLLHKDEDNARSRKYYVPKPRIYAEDYRSIHKWARRNVPKQIICSICKQEKKLEVANISGNYKHDVTDYEWCCHSCHVQAHKDGRHKNGKFKFINSEKDKIRQKNYYQRVNKRKENKYGGKKWKQKQD